MFPWITKKLSSLEDLILNFMTNIYEEICNWKITEFFPLPVKEESLMFYSKVRIPGFLSAPNVQKVQIT